MKGVVSQNEARIKLKVRGPNGRRCSVEAVVDTGSSGWLTLPQSVIDVLELPRTGIVRAKLANGSEAVFETFLATVIWNRRVLTIEIEKSEAMPLVGMSLLNGCELKIEIRDGGKVSIKPLIGTQRSPR